MENPKEDAFSCRWGHVSGAHRAGSHLGESVLGVAVGVHMQESGVSMAPVFTTEQQGGRPK